MATNVVLPKTAAVIAKMPVPVPVAQMPVTDIPAITDPLVIDLGSYASQFITVIAPAVAAALGMTVDFVLSEMPMGSIIKLWLSPQVISNYVSQGMTLAAGMAEAKIPDVTFNNPNWIERAAAGLLNAAEADLVSFLGTDHVSQSITDLVAKALPAPAAPIAGTSGKFGG